MNYVVSDIHNDNIKFCEILKQINFSDRDHIYILGDLFDRSSYNPDPVGVYFSVLKLGKCCSVIRGNHDQWLAAYILNYCQLSKKQHLPPYPYNSFELLLERMTLIDIKNLAKWILACPLQIVFTMGDEKYLLAHAMTSNPEVQKEEEYYLMGEMDKMYFEKGVEGYISICGHRQKSNHIWKNSLGNLYVCDCGCGYRDGRLGCLCLETKEEFYA